MAVSKDRSILSRRDALAAAAAVAATGLSVPLASAAVQQPLGWTKAQMTRCWVTGAGG